jgi:lipoprotein NlpI
MTMDRLMFGIVIVCWLLATGGSRPPLAGASAADKSSKELLKEAADFRGKGQLDRAIEAAGKAIALERDNARLYFFRGQLYEEAGQHEQAVADFSECLRLDPKNGPAWNSRGSEQFKLGKIKESVEDFDQFLKLQPENSHRHWKRGISLYYLGRFEDGKKQFEAYEKEDTNDVENAVWHFICNARAVGVEKARGQVLKIGKDARIPMMRVYELFKGQCKPEDVLAQAQEGQVSPELRKQQLFYAHLYLGIYHDILGDRKKALEHLALAADKYRIGHYMGDVARAHEQILRKQSGEK